MKSYIQSCFVRIRSAEFWRAVGTFLIHFPFRMLRILRLFSTFFLLLLFLVAEDVFGWIIGIPVIGWVFRLVRPIWDRTARPVVAKILMYLDDQRSFKVRRSYLIFIAKQNLLARKSRSFVTILGMSIGVGIIVYLLSLGYGIERLVINQIVSLNELSQIDVVAGDTTGTKINHEIIQRIASLEGVKSTFPIISIVGRLNYQNAKVDVVVNAVPRDYFETTQTQLVKGALLSYRLPEVVQGRGVVAGVSTQITNVQMYAPRNGFTVQFQIVPEKLVSVWDECSVGSKLLGSTKRLDGGYTGAEMWGGSYAPFEPYGKVGYDQDLKVDAGVWVQGKVALYTDDGQGGSLPALDEQGRQLWALGCIPRRDVQIFQEYAFGEVLAAATSSGVLNEASDSATPLLQTELVATDSGGVEIVRVSQEESNSKQATGSSILKFQQEPSGEVVVSSGLLSLLNIPLEDAIGKSFSTAFIITRSLMPDIQGKAFTEDAEYKVVGVVEDADNQYIYVPFDDIVALGVPYYSQARTITQNQDTLPSVRHEIETLGFKTSSAVDTVSQIENLFVNLKIVLVMIGMIALGIATLGMFNTLTVSLMERTREIGGMKTIGMVMAEIQDLFLAEAMIMGFAGGLGGLILGYGAGKLTSFVVSLFSISNGIGYLELTYVPSYLVFFILGCSFVVGIITGLYPAYRAQKISALNALRYE